MKVASPAATVIAAQVRSMGRPMLARFCDECGAFHFYRVDDAGREVPSGCVNPESPHFKRKILLEESKR